MRLRLPGRAAMRDLALGVVESTKPIMIIVPVDGGIQLEAKLLNRDAGFLETGQRVAIKLEAFHSRVSADWTEASLPAKVGMKTDGAISPIRAGSRGCAGAHQRPLQTRTL